MNFLLNFLMLTALLPAPPARHPVNKPHEPIAVIELFTSQGCSSCPPADRLLSEAVRAARQNGQRVYGLSFHVDYWDRLGWRDPFSQHAFTERQQQYSRQFALSSIYTPQGVVNGKQEFVGSNRSTLNRLLPSALQKVAPVEVWLDKPVASSHQLTLPYRLDGDLSDLVLNIAIVSKTTSTNVERGENAGLVLSHDNVVRVFQTVAADKSGQVTVKLPNDYVSATGAVIAYVQSRRTGAIVGADALDLQ